MHLNNGDTLEVSKHEARFLSPPISSTLRQHLQPTLIPPSEDIRRFEVDENLAWVLIVEKEVLSCATSEFGFTLTSNTTGTGRVPNPLPSRPDSAPSSSRAWIDYYSAMPAFHSLWFASYGFAGEGVS